MNNKRRERIEESSAKFFKILKDAISVYLIELDEIRTEEIEAYDNLPESIQGGDKGQEMQDCVDAMEEVIDTLDVDCVVQNCGIDAMLTACDIEEIEY